MVGRKVLLLLCIYPPVMLEKKGVKMVRDTTGVGHAHHSEPALLGTGAGDPHAATEPPVTT